MKCDLNRPSCSQCLNAGVHCEGYPSRVIWQSNLDSQKLFTTKSKTNANHAHGHHPASKLQQVDLVAAAAAGDSSVTDKVSPSVSNTNTSSPVSTSSNSVSPVHMSGIHKRSEIADPLSFITYEELYNGSTKKDGYDNNDSSVDPMKITNFLWGIKAILAAFNHAKYHNTRMPASNGVEKSEILSTIWKFVTSFLEHQESPTGSDQTWELESLQLKTTAIRELQQFVNEGVIEAIFSILAFTYFDVCQGSFGNWHRHIYGARSVLDIHCTNKLQLERAFENTPGLRHAITLLNWYDVLGVVASEDRPFIFEDWHREVIEDKFFLLVGCPKRVFYIFPELFKEQPLRIASCLRALQLVLAIPINARHSDDSIAAVKNTEYSWIYACLLIALEQTYGLPPTDLSIRTLVEKICKLVQLIPLQSALSQHLAVIVFVAGIRALNQSDREIVKRYWLFWKSAKVPLYTDALQRCEDSWRALDEMKTTPKTIYED